MSPATGKLLALSMLRGIGPAMLRKMAGCAGFMDMSRAELSARFPNVATVLNDDAAWATALVAAESQAELSNAQNIRIISAVDEDYPALLASTRDEPFLLWVKGKLAPDPQKSVAVIGTRQPTPHGKLIAERITHFFVSQQWSVVSGLALGCDAIAHQACLDAGGHTVAVLAHGLDTVSPSKHRKLADDILASGGALVSEYRIGHAVQPQQFVKRDRTQAGLAQGVVMVQSDLKGGSLHASRAALDYGRWLAVPYPTDADTMRNEPKIQANLCIASAGPAAMELLRCSEKALSQIRILRSKTDYVGLTASVRAGLDVQPLQSGLI